MNLSTLDIAIFIAYCLLLFGVAYWVSREKKGHEKNTSDYFLAGKTLPWWAIGASLIAANISAEQIIGMSGSGYAIGLAIASYEWMAAITLLLVAKYFIPIFLEKRIFTMPQFLEDRYDGRVRSVMAIFWIGVYVFVNLTSVLYLGALAIHTIAGVEMMHALIFLALFSASYSIYGGLKAVAFTDIIQVILLIGGGLMISYLALDKISQGTGFVEGFKILLTAAPEKFDMILSPENKHYASLPGLSVLLGGMWVMNFSYWGFNQYITQRALAAKDLREAQKGIAFAAFLKLLMPIIVVLPGIAAYVLIPDLNKPDQAYPELMKIVPSGILGLVFAALVAAVASSLSSMSNSISTIFTLDIYKRLINKNASDHNQVFVGRLVALISMVIAVIIAQPLLGKLDQAFQYIQEFTGFFTPGIVALFFLGFFWKKTTANGALCAAIGSFILSLLGYLYWPTLPFMDRVGLVFIACLVIGVVVSMFENKGNHPRAIDIAGTDFTTSRGFNYSTVAVCCILIALYVTWW